MICFIIENYGKSYESVSLQTWNLSLRQVTKCFKSFAIFSLLLFLACLTHKENKEQKGLNYIFVISEHSNSQWHSAFSVLIYALCIFFPYIRIFGVLLCSIPSFFFWL